MRTGKQTWLVGGLALVAAAAGVTWVVADRDERPVTASAQPSSTGDPSSGAPLPAAPSAPSVPASASISAPPSSVSATATRKPPKAPAKAVPRSRGSFPDAGSTGPRGKLKAPSGSMRVTKAGTVIDGVDVRGEISVEADNVTIRNSRVVNDGNWGIVQRPENKNLTVRDSEIRGNGKDRLQYAILNLGGTISILRTDMSRVSDAISTNVGLIEDNYLHDPVYFDGDHTDMIQSNSGPPAGQRLVIRHNTVINTLEQTAAVALFQDFGVQHDVVIERNLLAGGAYALYGGSGQKGASYNIKIIGNVFSREVYRTGGQYGPVAYWDGGGSGNVFEDNVWADTGRPVTAD